MKRVLGRVELLIAVTVVVAVVVFRCSSVDPPGTIHATQIDHRYVPLRDGYACFVTIEYTDADGTLNHEEIQVPEEDFRRFYNELYLCVKRGGLDGDRLVACE